MSSKKIVIIAGPNGAGKTTFAREFLPNEAGCPVFINADLIASGLSPFNPEVAAIKAGRLMLEEIKAYVRNGTSFAFETTLSGRGYVRMIKDWRDKNYLVKLIFLSLESPEEAIARVAARCVQGGHYIPDEIVRRRFHQGLKMFQTVYKHEVDLWRLYNNSSDMPILIDEGRRK
ncbi:MAG: zeta toxin family protein [Candidatus Obscuribacterales bacterium]|nr:zeta toxin family protein [Candidatus Obscuribacterales bacterium]